MLDLGLAGEVAIVTGGSEGLGRGCAERLAGECVKPSDLRLEEGLIPEPGAGEFLTRKRCSKGEA